MRPSIHFSVPCLILIGLGCAIAWVTAEDRSVPAGNEAADRPLLALWRQNSGFVDGDGAPYLRFTVWADGRVVFARDPSQWGHELLREALPDPCGAPQSRSR